MSTRVRGRLGVGDQADTYTLWQRPGECVFELSVRGEGSAVLVVEVADAPNGDPFPPSPPRRTIEGGTPVQAGSRRSGSFTVPDVELTPGAMAPWVQLYVRIERLDPGSAVEYELSLDRRT